MLQTFLMGFSSLTASTNTAMQFYTTNYNLDGYKQLLLYKFSANNRHQHSAMIVRMVKIKAKMIKS